MDEALIGLVGIVFGALLGGTGKYWLLRRDAWREARRSGLLLLADVRALRNAESTDRVISNTELGVKTWESHRQVLAGFRRGNFPHGFKAEDWLKLASHFARLEVLYPALKSGGDGNRWEDARAELDAAEGLLNRWERDPPVVGYVIRSAIGREPK